MAYGTAAGVRLVMGPTLYDQLVGTGKELLASDVSTYIGYADGEIDARIAAVVDVSTLPLASPPAKVVLVSNILAAYFLLRAQFTDKDPNKSDWVESFKTDADENLEWLVENPQIILDAAGTTATASTTIENSTENYDEKAYVDQTNAGEDVDLGDKGEMSMDDW